REGDKWEFKRDETVGLKAFEVGTLNLTVSTNEQQLVGNVGQGNEENALLSDESLVQYTATEFALKLYVLESAAYYLAGLLDERLPVVLDIENALIHVETHKRCAKQQYATCVDWPAYGRQTLLC
ncbi:hypothetical protein OESDEN_19570, partial [Oesophagostomum dentatum]